MTDAFASDDKNLSELVDDDKLPEEYPPDEPTAVDDYGTTAREQVVPEPIDERVAREEPDQGLGGSAGSDVEVGELVEPDAGAGTDETAEAVAHEEPEHGSRPLPPEQSVPQSAEGEAVHRTEEPPMGDGDGYLET